MALILTAQDLPDVADQLDTIAEHDLAVTYDASAPFSEDDLSEARQKIRAARVLLLEAADLLGGDDDEDASDAKIAQLRRLLSS